MLARIAVCLILACECACAALQDFGQVAVGAAPASATLTYSFTGLSAAPTFALAWGRDFRVVSPVCLVGATTTTCTIAISFAPSRPGIREDAVTAQNGSGAILATTILHGVGLSPLLALYPGVISTTAGNGTWGYEDSSNPANAMFRNPQCVALDGSANAVYVADSVNGVIRKIVISSGNVSTVAGNGSNGYSGDGGPATSATLNTPTGLAVDSAGNLYIADQGNNLIRRVDAITRVITTVAGGGTTASQADGLGDGGPATSAILSGPQSVAVDPSGNLYIADTYHNRVRAVTASSGIISVFAGGGTNAGSDGLGDGGAATSAQLDYPTAVTIDSAGNTFIADAGDNLIRRVDATSGVITAVAGNGTWGYSGDAGLATAAMLASPQGIAVDAAGNLYIADYGNNAIRLVSASSQKITTIAGRGSTGYYGDGGDPTVAFLSNPTSVTLDESGNLYIADYGNNVVRQVSVAAWPVVLASEPMGAISPALLVSPVSIGNQTLNLSAIAFTGNFTQSTSGASDCAAATALTAGSSCSIAVVFEPSQSGPANGTMGLTTNSLNTSTVKTVNLSGTGLAGGAPVATLSASSLTFTGQAIGMTSKAQTVTLSNTGSSSFSISSIWLSGSEASDFQLSSTCSLSLSAGAACTISITFSPSATGVRNAVLTISDSVAGSPQTLSVSGTGDSGIVSLSSTALNFVTILGETSPPQNVVLSNTGSYPLNILSVWLSGNNSAQFHVSTACPATLAAGAKCPIAVTFTPSAAGSESATLSITDDGAGSPQTITLTGTGAPRLHYPTRGYAGEGTQQSKISSVGSKANKKAAPPPKTIRNRLRN